MFANLRAELIVRLAAILCHADKLCQPLYGRDDDHSNVRRRYVYRAGSGQPTDLVQDRDELLRRPQSYNHHNRHVFGRHRSRPRCCEPGTPISCMIST
jgi:hypothetical protein